MNHLKYVFSALLIIWGLVIGWVKLFSVGIHLPLLTILIVVAVISGLSRYRHANVIFFIAGFTWMMFSFETVGFIIYFDSGNYGRMIIALIPLTISFLVLMCTRLSHRAVNTVPKKLVLLPIAMLLGIGSYVYKPSTHEVNCWFYIGDKESYNVLFAESPNRTFEVSLSSDELKAQVKSEGMRCEGIEGYYCPQTKVRVVTRFSKIISATVVAFTNTAVDVDKEVRFSIPAPIDLNKVKGNIDILKPYALTIWD